MDTPSYEKQPTQFRSPQEELEFLRARVAEQEQKMREERIVPDRESIIKNELEEYKKAPDEQVLAAEHRAAPEEKQMLAHALGLEDATPQINQLLGIVNEKGIKNAMSVVAGMKNAHLEDDFHKFLVQYISHGYVIDSIKEKSTLDRSLHMTLFEVILPSGVDEESQRKTLKELLGAMEQFYAGMLAVSSQGKKLQQYFTLEIALAHIGQEVSFYCSVESSRKEQFFKQLLAVFPKASINEVKGDYNIFNEQGTSLGAYATYSKNAIYPIKTYDAFEHDPISIILNAFSKLAHEGEGAAIQLIIKADTKDISGRYRDAIKKIEKGEKVGDAIKVPLTVSGELFQTAKLLFASEPKKKEEDPVDKQQERQMAIEQIGEKTKSPIALSNLRVVVSAPEKRRAEEMMSIFESTFSQFENTQGNKITFSQVPQRKLQTFFHNFSFRLFDSSYQIPFNIKELTSLIHFPVREGVGQQGLKESKMKTAPAPLSMPQEGVFIGTNVYQGSEKEIYMTPKDRVRHLYVIGQTGTGKTNALTSIICQDIKNGDGCCFIDPHGSDIETILANVPPERYEDVIYFDPAYAPRPMALNMLEYDPAKPEQKTFVINEMLSIFNKLFDMKTAGGPMFEQYFRNATALVIEDPESGSTLLEVSRLLADENFRKLKLSRCKNPIVTQFWTEIAGKAGGEASLQNIVPYITSKFDVFLANDIMRPIIAQEKSSFNFRKVMDERKILLVNLSKGRLGDINANLIGLILVGKILMAALSRVDNLGGDLAPFYLYIDEFQNVTTDSISQILSEARKYKLSLNVAHQFIAQLDEGIKDAVFGNVGSMLVHRVGADDAQYLESQFQPIFTASDIMKIDNYNSYARILSNGIPVKPFSLLEPAAPEGNPDQIPKLKELSFMKYGQDRAQVEEEIMGKYNASKNPPAPPQTPPARPAPTPLPPPPIQQSAPKSGPPIPPSPMEHPPQTRSQSIPQSPASPQQQGSYRPIPPRPVSSSQVPPQGIQHQQRQPFPPQQYQNQPRPPVNPAVPQNQIPRAHNNVGVPPVSQRPPVPPPQAPPTNVPFPNPPSINP